MTRRQDSPPGVIICPAFRGRAAVNGKAKALRYGELHHRCLNYNASGRVPSIGIRTLAAVDRGSGLVQGNDGIDPHRAARGDVAGRERDDGEDNCDTGEGG